MKLAITTCLLLTAACLLAGCGTTQWLDCKPGTVRVGVAGTPEVTPYGFANWHPLDRPNGKGSIQTVDTGGTEYHAPWLWRPDRHTYTSPEPVEYYKRTMTIREGEAEGYRMAPWGVALLYGWGPRQNWFTQSLFGQQGRIVSEDLSTQTVWTIELWGTEVPPRMRVTCVDTGDYLEFTGE